MSGVRLGLVRGGEVGVGVGIEFCVLCLVVWLLMREHWFMLKFGMHAASCGV